MTCDGEDRTDRELLIITPSQTMGFEFFFFFFWLKQRLRGEENMVYMKTRLLDDSNLY